MAHVEGGWQCCISLGCQLDVCLALNTAASCFDRLNLSGFLNFHIFYLGFPVKISVCERAAFPSNWGDGETEDSGQEEDQERLAI